MFYRRKILLALLQEFDNELDKLHLLKLLFIFTQKQTTKVYDFIPYQFGCFSYSVYADINSLVQKNILIENNSSIVLNEKVDYFGQLKQEDKYFLNQIKQQFRTMSNDDLIHYTYINYPYWATKSIIAQKILSDEEYAKVLQCKSKFDKTILFTIGYEGISLEEYLNRLIINDVKILVDVRRNPFSMKYGFSKSQLQRYCKNLGIEYLHFPEVGIESEQRQQLNTQADYDRLFEVYRMNNIPKTTVTQNEIFELLKHSKRIALTCFEANINQCHRKYLAEAIANLPRFDYELIHI
ncbi:MAG: DUF488 domain-containing protein [Bacteroidales bacterium]|jgi:uncharacterized protein (DUF488 family)|nr:DUF488 domain-containing protein [Bacteroidales bacterium]